MTSFRLSVRATAAPALFRAIALGIALTGALDVSAHVSLPPGGATQGTDYNAAFRVSHACKNAKTTTGITVRLPPGFNFISAEPRAGWALASSSGTTPGNSAAEVSWRADAAASAVPDSEHAEFVVRGKLPNQPGPLWFKVLQRCDIGVTDWAQVPALGRAASGLDAAGAGAESNGLAAARLDVLAPGVAPVDVRDGWVRPAVAGQSGTGAFMKLNAPSGARLVGISTPVAGVAQVHEMKMDGDVMKMRAVTGGLALPARQNVVLKPGGYHVMLMDLKRPVVQGATVPMTLRFEDAQGVPSSLELALPVGAPAGETAGNAGGHQHAH